MVPPTSSAASHAGSTGSASSWYISDRISRRMASDTRGAKIRSWQIQAPFRRNSELIAPKTSWPCRVASVSVGVAVIYSSTARADSKVRTSSFMVGAPTSQSRSIIMPSRNLSSRAEVPARDSRRGPCRGCAATRPGRSAR